MNHRIWRVGKPVIILAVITLLGETVMLLWNAVMPVIFTGLHPIDFWHAVGLLVLSRILFGGFRGGGGWHQRRHWRRWEGMTNEEREAFKKSFADRHKSQEQA